MCELQAEIEVDVVRLDSDAIDEHIKDSSSILLQILQGDTESVANTDVHECSHCGKLYKTVSTLRRHVLLKHPKCEVEVRCMSCDKPYASLLSLEKHWRYMHRYPHRCKACYRTFKTPDLLAVHSASCCKLERPCPACGKVYDSALSLRNHVKYKHPEQKSNWCDICRRAFTSTSNLANHIATIHPDGTSCSSCDKQFNSVAALQSHFLYKHSENGARCHVCSKVFSTRRSLHRHLSDNHSFTPNEGTSLTSDYTCGICNANFQGSQSLVDHVITLHTESSS